MSQYPSAVTVAMVMTYLAGRATANAFAAANDIGVRVIDIGVAAELPVHPKLVDAKVRMGTANAAREPAMTAEHAADALTRGFRIAVGEIKAGADIIALGEMGIGNTASSALVVHRLAPAPWMIVSALAPGRMMPAWRASARRSRRRQHAATQLRRWMCLPNSADWKSQAWPERSSAQLRNDGR